MRDGSWIDDESIYCSENALASFVFPAEQEKNKGKYYFKKTTEDNLKYIIIPLIKDNPNMTFRFYMVPYSIAYWYMEKSKGNLDVDFYMVKKLYPKFLVMIILRCISFKITKK